MLSERADHTATRLANGQVLMAGGYSSTDPAMLSAELFDPTTASWIPTGSMRDYRKQHAATLLATGEVLVTGGWRDPDGPYANSPRRTAELYDPTSRTWAPTASLNVARFGHTMTLLQNGRVLVAGGCCYDGDLASAELYDPVTRSWSLTGRLSVARFGATAIALNDGRVLLYGGSELCPCPPPPLRSEIYDPAMGTWSAIADMPGGLREGSVTLLADGRVLAAGMYNPVTCSSVSTQIYDPKTDAWSAAADMLFPDTAWLTLQDGTVLATSTWGSYDVWHTELFVNPGFGSARRSAFVTNGSRAQLRSTVANKVVPARKTPGPTRAVLPNKPAGAVPPRP